MVDAAAAAAVAVRERLLSLRDLGAHAALGFGSWGEFFAVSWGEISGELHPTREPQEATVAYALAPDVALEGVEMRDAAGEIVPTRVEAGRIVFTVGSA